MEGLFNNKKHKPTVKEFLSSKDIFWYARIAGLIALIVCFTYWGFLSSEDHRWLSRALLASTIAFNLFYNYVYNREMKRREKERE